MRIYLISSKLELQRETKFFKLNRAETKYEMQFQLLQKK